MCLTIKHTIKHLHSFVSHLLLVREVVVQICSGLGTVSLTPQDLCSGL